LGTDRGVPTCLEKAALVLAQSPKPIDVKLHACDADVSLAVAASGTFRRDLAARYGNGEADTGAWYPDSRNDRPVYVVFDFVFGQRRS
jgi:hypothetical protein